MPQPRIAHALRGVIGEPCPSSQGHPPHNGPQVAGESLRHVVACPSPKGITRAHWPSPHPHLSPTVRTQTTRNVLAPQIGPPPRGGTGFCGRRHSPAQFDDEPHLRHGCGTRQIQQQSRARGDGHRSRKAVDQHLSASAVGGDSGRGINHHRAARPARLVHRRHVDHLNPGCSPCAPGHQARGQQQRGGCT